METKRKLASIQKIVEIRDIIGADKIQVAMMEGLGWECVVKKGEYNIGDSVIYIEVDAKVPETSAFEFLRDRKFRIKIIRLKKQVSMGLIMPINILPKAEYVIGQDVTDVLGVTNYVKEVENLEEIQNIKQPKSKVLKYLMRFAPVRYVYLKLNKIEKGNWPQWEGASKSDEERIQNCAKIIADHFDEEWYISEKIDGKSFSTFLHHSLKWGFNTWNFGVCSRNLQLKTPDNSDYWRVTKKYDLENKLRKFKTELFLQAELIGEKIQGNKYKRSDLELHVFTIVENGKRVSLKRMQEITTRLGLNTVPILEESFIPSQYIKSKEIKDIVIFMVNKSIGVSRLFNVEREGIVMRLKSNPYISCKIINPEFLLSQKD